MNYQIRYKGTDPEEAYNNLRAAIYNRTHVVPSISMLKQKTELKHKFLLTGESVYILNIEL